MTERWDWERDTHHDMGIILPPTLRAGLIVTFHAPSSASALLTDFSLLRATASQGHDCLDHRQTTADSSLSDGVARTRPGLPHLKTQGFG